MLERYLHYYTRYDNHHKSKKIESTLTEKMKLKMERLTTLDKTNPSYIDQVPLRLVARACLTHARRCI